MLNFKNKDCKIDDATHTFDSNGEYTFKYFDPNGRIGEVLAKVDWINLDKDGNILENPKTGFLSILIVVAILIISIFLSFVSKKKLILD